MKGRCRKCKGEIEKGFYCDDCWKEVVRIRMDKARAKKVAKYKETDQYAISKVKEVADQRYWATSHKNCFRASFSAKETMFNQQPETEKHINTKFERWKYHRKLGRIVFTELRLKDGNRPDLIVIDKGFIFCEEIVNTEEEQSLLKKAHKYPFNINIIRIGGQK